jgi:hypothetical protein
MKRVKLIAHRRHRRVRHPDGAWLTMEGWPGDLGQNKY